MIKTAIVTGSSRGIGFAAAKALLEKGYNVLISARTPTDDVRVLEEKHGKRLRFVRADIGAAEDRERLICEALEQYGRIDLLVNCAGVAPRVRKDMLEIEESDYDYVMNINLKGTYFLTQAVANWMCEHAVEGQIINIGSISAERISLNRAEYCISKAGERMLTQLFAARLAPFHIGVFEISPGVIETQMIQKVREKYEKLAEDGVIPMKRLGTPEDVAKMVCAIADGAMDYATGTVFHCTGGLHIPIL